MRRLVSSNIFTPIEGEIYLNNNGTNYTCIKVLDKGKAIMKSESGLVCKCYNIHKLENDTIDWDYSTNRYFDKQANIKEDLKKQIKDKFKKPYINFKDVLTLKEEDEIKKKYKKVKDKYTSFNDFCKKEGYEKFNINKINFNEYKTKLFMNKNNLKIKENKIMKRLIQANKVNDYIQELCNTLEYDDDDEIQLLEDYSYLGLEAIKYASQFDTINISN